MNVPKIANKIVQIVDVLPTASQKVVSSIVQENNPQKLTNALEK